MCGRFQLDVNDSEFRSIFKSLNYTPTNSVSESGDFTPSLLLPSLCLNRNGKIAVKALKWGLSAPSGKGLLINARSETVLQNLFSAPTLKTGAASYLRTVFTNGTRKRKKYYLKGTTVQCFFLAEYSEGLKPTINV